MRFLSTVMFLLSIANYSVADQSISPEEHFILGTNLLKPGSEDFNPDKGLQHMLLAADRKYEHAPFGLCVALSIEQRILDLEHAYAWCYIAGKIGNKYSDLANRRQSKIGAKIEAQGGNEALKKANARAINIYRD